MSDYSVFVFAFSLSAFAGIASLIRTGEKRKITRIAVFSSFLNSGLLGLCISLLWYTQYRENTEALVGMCIIAGLGGNKSIEYVVKVFREKIGKEGSSGK